MVQILKDILDGAYDRIKGKALIAPLAIAAIVSSAANVGAKVIADIKARKAAEKLDREKAEAKKREMELANQQVEVAKGVVRQGDPTLAEKQRLIKESGANIVGQAKATSQSTQEIIKAAQATQANVDKANNAALSVAGERDLNAKKLLAERFNQAGRQRLLGDQIINQEANAALQAIGLNAQAAVDTVQNVGSIFTQAAGLGAFDKKKPVAV